MGEGLAAGQYVSLFGNVRTAPEFHFAVAGIRPVRTADEVSYHMIEVAHTAMRLQDGSASAVQNAQPRSPKTPEPKKTGLSFRSNQSCRCEQHRRTGDAGEDNAGGASTAHRCCRVLENRG